MPAFTALTPVGAGVTDVRGRRARRRDRSTSSELLWPSTAWSSCPARTSTTTRFLRFLRSFGETVFTVGETPVPGCPDLNVISNVGRTTPPRSTFHTDTSYVRNPPAYTALRAVDVPEQGGQTLFTNQYAAYETLPERRPRRASAAAPSPTS